MPLGSVAYENLTFRCFYGDARAAIAPASFTLHLYDGHPLDGGAELPATGGYLPVPVANTTANFPLPVNGQQEMVPQDFAAATAAWPNVGRYAALKDPSGTLVEYWRLARGHMVKINEAGAVARVPGSLFHNDIETL